MEKLTTIAVHWYNRKQNLKESINLFMDFYYKFQTVNSEVFKNLYEKGWNKKSAKQKIVKIDYQSLFKLFGMGINEFDYPEFAFDFDFWNGLDKDAECASISISLGGSGTKNFANNCVINIPYEGNHHDFFQIKENQNKLIDLMIDFWKPEFILLNCNKYPVKNKKIKW